MQVFVFKKKALVTRLEQANRRVYIEIDVIRAFDPGSARRGRGIALALLLTGPSLALVLAWGSVAASPYEPNDALGGAAGPLELGQTFTAALETPSDRDFFYFYVTSPRMPQAELTVSNLGGEGKATDIDATILDSMATPIVAQSYIGKGEGRLLAVALEPGKYYVEVAVNQGFGDSYSLSAAGGDGAFGTYPQILGRCERAMAEVGALQTKLSRAESRLQRATARLRRSRYGTLKARGQARAAHREAKRRVRKAKLALRTARAAQEPWCGIAP
jgi:hypothetical protein